MMFFGANFLYFYLQNSFETIEIKMVSAANIFPSRAVSEMAGCSREEEKYNEPKRLEEVRILSVFLVNPKNCQIIGCLRALSQEDLLKHYIGLNNRLEENSDAWIDGPGGVSGLYLIYEVFCGGIYF